MSKLHRIIFIILILIISAFCLTDQPQAYRFPALNFFPEMPVAAGNPVTVEGAELGRLLFYDTALSIDSTISCASCHRQEAAFSDAPNVFSKGMHAEMRERNTPPLFNLAWHPSLFWDGKSSSIEDQIFHPVRT